MREFDSGATRDSDDGKLDYDGFLSPLVLKRYAEYMHKHRKQADGTMRSSDNWQKGLPTTETIKSLWRHFVDLWTIARGWGLVCDPKDSHIVTDEEALCAIIFNASSYLHEVLKARHMPIPPYPDVYDGIMEEDVSELNTDACLFQDMPIT